MLVDVVGVVEKVRSVQVEFDSTLTSVGWPGRAAALCLVSPLFKISVLREGLPQAKVVSLSDQFYRWECGGTQKFEPSAPSLHGLLPHRTRSHTY